MASCTSHCLSSEATVPLLNLFLSQQEALVLDSQPYFSGAEARPASLPHERSELLEETGANISKHPGLYFPKLSLSSETSKPTSPNCPISQLQDSKFYSRNADSDYQDCQGFLPPSLLCDFYPKTEPAFLPLLLSTNHILPRLHYCSTRKLWRLSFGFKAGFFQS